MIGFISQPTGRLGNILLQYIFMREIASRIDMKYYHPLLKGTEYFENLDETDNFRIVKKRIFGKKKISINNIKKMGLENFNNYLEKTNKTIVLVPPILGYTFETLYEDPNKFLKIKQELQKPYFNYEDYFVIAMHFRGTDFAEWNPMACLDAEYYINAIKHCMDKYKDRKLMFSLFTDDLTIESYKKTIEYLNDHSCTFHAGDPNRNLGEECYNISISDVVVSSPSTFAITASLIGKKKSIIHSKKWCDYSVERNDAVWVQMMKNQCKYYFVDCIL